MAERKPKKTRSRKAAADAEAPAETTTEESN